MDGNPEETGGPDDKKRRDEDEAPEELVTPEAMAPPPETEEMASPPHAGHISAEDLVAGREVDEDASESIDDRSGPNSVTGDDDGAELTVGAHQGEAAMGALQADSIDIGSAPERDLQDQTGNEPPATELQADVHLRVVSPEEPAPSQDVPVADAPAATDTPGETGAESALVESWPGNAFVEAREARGLDLKKLADDLRLKPQMLRHLEEGNFDALPDRAYIAGYLRSYARALELDPAPFISAYKAIAGDHVAPYKSLNPTHSVAESGGSMTMFAVVLVVVALAALSLWYFLAGPGAQHTARTERSPAMPSKTVLIGDGPVDALFGTKQAGAATMAPSENEVARNSKSGEADAAERANAGLARTGLARTGSASGGAVPAERTLPAGFHLVHGGDDATLAAEAVSLRAIKPNAWVRIEDGGGRVYFEGKIGQNQTQILPQRSDLIMIARDAGAFEVRIGDEVVGLAGPSNLMLTGKPLDPVLLRQRQSAAVAGIVAHP